jgi:hypothetical protein
MSSFDRSTTYVVTDVLDQPNGYPGWAQDIARWVRREICRPVPELGRPGALCPYVPIAVKRGSLTLIECPLPAEPRHALVSALADAAGWLLDRLAGADSTAEIAWMAHIVVFTGLGQHGDILGNLSTQLRPGFLRNGINLGEFYPDNTATSVRNSRIRVGRSPWPCVALRHFQPKDETFYHITPDEEPRYRSPRPAVPGYGSGR